MPEKIDGKLGTTPEEHEVMKAYFEKLGFDVSELPWRRDGGVGGPTLIYQNLYRDNSGNFYGYLESRPQTTIFKTIEGYAQIRPWADK